jgi:hypothetical protein
MEDQLLITWIEIKRETAGVLNAGFIPHEQDVPFKLFPELRVLLTFIQQIMRAFGFLVRRARD